MKRLHQLVSALAVAYMSVSLHSCSMMEEDRSDCPTGLYVRFVYDYNTQRADMFKDHVGYVKVYVFDETGRKVAEKSIANTSASLPLSQYGYAMHFTSDELPSGHAYRLQAIALQRDWQTALQSPGAKYRHDGADTPESLAITLDHDANPSTGSQPDGPHAVDNSAPLDTLWHTLKVMPTTPRYGYSAPALPATSKPYSIYPTEEQTVEVCEGYATYATISLIRDTKHLNVTLQQLDNPESVHADDYEVSILDDNAVLAADNSVLHGDSLSYRPYSQWTTLYDGNGVTVEDEPHPASRASVEERTAHYNIMFNRLVYPSEAGSRSARLRIVNRQSRAVVADVALALFLAECRTSPLWTYQPQEYLDREYDYELNFFLRGDQWAYCSIRIHATPWAVRKQNVELQ